MAPSRCRTCRKVGGHYPSCCTLRPALCKACGAPRESRPRLYCDRCREAVCPECRSYGGHHTQGCLWIHRARLVLRRHYQGLSPSKRPYRGVVSREDIGALYEAYQPQAIRLAHALGANGDSEDCVHDVTLWLIERQDYLQSPPTKAYFLTAVKRAVLERARTSYIQRTVWADYDELVNLEAMEYAHAHGRARPPAVTLPEPVG
jgi:Sigma-70 region 2